VLSGSAGIGSTLEGHPLLHLRTILLLCLVVPLLGAPVYGHGGEPPPPPEQEEPPPMPPRPEPPPPPPPPPRPPPHEQTPPVEPPEQKPPVGPRGPRAPDPERGRGPTSGSRKPRLRKPGLRTASSTDAIAWRIWWGYNRESLVGLRGKVRAAVTTSGTKRNASAWPLAERHEEVLAALRQVALHDRKPAVRAAAVIALGRIGNDDDARSLLRILHDKRASREVQEAAAVAMAILPPIRDPEVREATRKWFAHVIAEPRSLPSRTRGLCLLAAGMRARDDSMLVMQLSGRAAGKGFSSEEAGTLAYAMGLTQSPMVAPELSRAIRKRRLGGDKLSDIGRAHAAQGLGFMGDGLACRTLVALLQSRSAGVQSRRSAALALGRVMSASKLDPEMRERGRKALVKALNKDRDVIVRGYCAVALGSVRDTDALGALDRTLRDGARVTIKPFCALGVGLWARNAPTAGRTRAREILRRELNGAREPQFTAALCIAAGLAGARNMRDDLLAILERTGKPVAVRGAAAEGLGLLGTTNPEVVAVLEAILKQGKKPELLQDAALALGLMGRRAAAGDLARALRGTRSTVVQSRIILALGHLGHQVAVDPMLKILKDQSESTLVREFAAVALGLMGDRRERDPLFELDAWFNYYATTRATNEFLRLY